MTAAYVAAAITAAAYITGLRIRVATLRSRLASEQTARRDAEQLADRQTRAADYLRARCAGWPPAAASEHADEARLFRRLEREMRTP